MTVSKVGIALLAGLVVLVLLFPASGTSSNPPTCYSVLGYVVPCDAWVAWAVGAATAAVVGLALWLADRLRERRGPTTGSVK
jgi:hypothetical protein